MDDVPDSDETIQTMAMSKYVTSEGLCNYLNEKKGEFSVMTLNADNLFKSHTKLLLLTRLLETQGCALSAICIQECYFSDNNCCTDLIEIPNYELIPQTSKLGRNHGLAIYLHISYKYTKRMPLCYKGETWDAQFIDIKSDFMKKPVTLANIYRLPPYNAEMVESFNRKLNSILKTMGWPGKYQILVDDTNLN